MSRQLCMRADEPPFCEIVARATESLAAIAEHLCVGRIDPSRRLRLCRAEPAASPTTRPVRLGVFPVTANPLHWGHLLAVLEAVAALALDRVALMVQGVDHRKALASEQTEPDRHALAREAITLLAPLAAYSDVGRGNDGVGEQNVFRLLHWNRDVPLVVHYLAGGDHYRLTDPQGQPDTLPRLAASTQDRSSSFDPSKHQLEVVFVERGLRGPPVPSPLPVHFIQEALNGSSTEVRAGRLALLPHVVLRYLAGHPDYAATIGMIVAQAAAVGRVKHDTRLPLTQPEA